MGATKAKHRGQQLAFYDGTTYETVRPIAPMYLEDDFNGTAVNGDIWNGINTNDATVVVAGGSATCTLVNTDETEDAGLVGLDNKMWNIDKGLVFECRLAVSVLPNQHSEILIGVQNDTYASGSNRVAAADEVDKHAFFVLDGAASVLIYTDDGTVECSAALDTGIDMTASATAFKIFKIDFTNSADVKFYIDGVQIVTTSAVKMNTTANLLVQPVVVVLKPHEAGVGTIVIDYVRLWQATR